MKIYSVRSVPNLYWITKIEQRPELEAWALDAGVTLSWETGDFFHNFFRVGNNHELFMLRWL